MISLEKNKNLPKVSIMIPTYNQELFIADAIQSALAQDYGNLEIIISDDCSSDNSVEIINQYIKTDNRIKLFSTSRNSGTASVPRNLGIKNATGDYIAFLDTDDMKDVYDFCEEFLPIFEKVCRENLVAFDETANIFIQAEVTLQNYHRQIENKEPEIRVYRGQNCSITAQPDSKLESSIMYRNLWVKPLKRDDIINLRPYKNYLQTAALICAEHEHAELSQKLLKTGLVKISDGFEMSNYAFGEAHDGVFALRGYTKLVSVQSHSG